MKIVSYRKLPVICLIVCALVICAPSIEAQRKTVVKNPKKTYKVQSLRKKTNTKRKEIALQIVSGGVVNGKAIILVKPEYPISARTINVYGKVSIFVLIDGNGNVVESSAKNGHPLLRPVSIKAALHSKFEPQTLGGNPVRVRGIIVYNFIPEKWNWLEIGYTLSYGSNYYSIKTLLQTLPYEFEEERQLLNQWLEANENQDEIIETVIASIRNKLNNDAKTSWLFEVGLSLAKYKQESNIIAQELDRNLQSFENLKRLIENPPSGVNETLLERMKKFIVFVDEGKTNQIFLALEKLEESFPYAGK